MKLKKIYLLKHKNWRKLLPPIDSNNSADKKKREDLSKIIANKAKK